MKILYLNLDAGVPVLGTKGASVHVRSMCEALVRAGHEVRILARRAGAELRHVTPPPESPLRAGRTFAVEGPAPRIRAFSVEELAPMAPDNNPGEQIRSIVLEWSPDLVYERYSLWATEGVRVAHEFSIPHFLEVNAPLPEEAYRYRDLEDLDRARDVAREIFTSATRILAVSRPLADYVAGYGVPADSIRVMPNAIDRQLFEGLPDRPELQPGAANGDESPPATISHGGGNARAFTLGFCGSLKPWHGIDDLLRIFVAVRKVVPETRLVVVGDGPGRERLELGARAAGAGKSVAFTGAVEHAAIPGWLSVLDVALAPYPRLESFYFSPLKIFEYLAAGVPVVATNQGDLPLLIRNGGTGLLYEPGDIEAAVRLVLDLHSDPVRALQMGRRGRAEVLAHHTWDARGVAIARWAVELRAGSGVASAAVRAAGGVA